MGAARLAAGGSITFLALLGCGLILSPFASQLPIFVFQRTAPSGAVLTNGELLVVVCLCSLVVTALVWGAAYFAYLRPRGGRVQSAQVAAAWLIISVASGLFIFLGPPAARMKSDADAAEAIVQQYNAHIPGKYRAELQSLGLPERLSADGLARDDLGETEARLKSVRSDIPRFRALAETNAADMRQRIASSSTSPALKANLLAQMDRDHALGQRYWNDEVGRVQEWIQAVELLRANPGRWGEKGGKLVFSPGLFAEAKPHNDAIAAIDADEREICRASGACRSQ